MSLPDEIISYIFYLLPHNAKYFVINKRIYYLRKQYLLLHFNKNYQYILKSNRKYWLLTMIKDNKLILNKDLRQYRKFILNFVTRNKQSIIYPCKNSYHRMLVHQFCETQGLLHETIIHGYKKVRGCCKCYSHKIMIDKNGYGDYNFTCFSCNYTTSNYSSFKLFDTYVEVDLKAIKISKK